MRFIKFGFYSLAISGLFLGSNQTSASAFTIDLFGESQFAGSNLATDGTFTDDSVTGSANIFGGDRFLSTTISGGSGSFVTFNGINIFGNKAAIITEPGATVGGYFEWAGIDGVSSEDLTGGLLNLDSIQVSIDSVSEEVNLEFTLEDADGTTGTLSKNIPDEQTGNYYYSFNDFSSSGGTVAGLDFEAIDYIRMGTVGTIQPQMDLSFSLVQSAVQPVPFEFSPSLGLIFCGGLFGVSKLRKRLTASKA